jgi:hypothetical protein
MEIDVVTGWQGWTWTGPGARASAQVPLTNPVWLCINVYLFCLRLKDAPSSVQEQYFDVAAAVSAASICDTLVDRIVETWEGQSKQFKFIGQLSDQRPLRDWLTDILTNCLGYYSFAFGKLRLGIRYHASPLSAYDAGSIVFRTLQAGPIGPQFTKLVMSFADSEYNWQPNTASYQDDDYATELGGGARALHKIAQMNLSGTHDIDQATRLVISRAREEIGGVSASERRLARRVTFKTTLLGLDTGPGDVISVYDAELPGNMILARVETYSLAPDWSVTITARGVTPSMYQYDVGPIPAAAKPGPVKPVPYSTREPVWMPNWALAAAGDPIFGQDELGFSLIQTTSVRSDNSLQITLTIFGYQPVNTPLASAGGPRIGTFTTASTGGYLPGGHSVYFAISLSSSQGFSPTSNLVSVAIPPGTNTNAVTLSNIVLSGPVPGDTWTTLTLYAALDDPRLLTSQLPYTTTPSAIVNGNWTIQGTSVTLPLDRARLNPPAADYFGLIAKAKYLYHSGVVGIQVNSVTAATIVCGGLATNADDWTNRVVSIIAAPLGEESKLWNFTVTAYDNTTGTFTVGPDPVAAGVKAGAVLVVRYQADTITETSIGDSKIINSQYPFGQSDQIQNAQIRIIHGKGSKQIRNIISNTASVYTIDQPWDGTQNDWPDKNSLWIIEARDWTYQSEVLIPGISDVTTPINLKLPADNLDLLPIVVGVFLVDRGGNETNAPLIPVRDTYLFGVGQGYAPQTVTSDYTINSRDQVIFVDTSKQNITITMPDPTFVKGMQHAVTIKRRSATANTNLLTVTSPALIDGAASVTLSDEGQSLTILPTNP